MGIVRSCHQCKATNGRIQTYDSRTVFLSADTHVHTRIFLFSHYPALPAAFLGVGQIRKIAARAMRLGLQSAIRLHCCLCLPLCSRPGAHKELCVSVRPRAGLTHMRMQSEENNGHDEVRVLQLQLHRIQQQGKRCAKVCLSRSLSNLRTMNTNTGTFVNCTSFFCFCNIW